ncbi:hypothetical protein FRC07_005942 [Ceratobasidium sp. 392]|nr:hypothetical protein FRC07_005942 [Ceratobasidium sp. 392]
MELDDSQGRPVRHSRPSSRGKESEYLRDEVPSLAARVGLPPKPPSSETSEPPKKRKAIAQAQEDFAHPEPLPEPNKRSKVAQRGSRILQCQLDNIEDEDKQKEWLLQALELRNPAANYRNRLDLDLDDLQNLYFKSQKPRASHSENTKAKTAPMEGLGVKIGVRQLLQTGKTAKNQTGSVSHPSHLSTAPNNATAATPRSHDPSGPSNPSKTIDPHHLSNSKSVPSTLSVRQLGQAEVSLERSHTSSAPQSQTPAHTSQPLKGSTKAPIKVSKARIQELRNSLVHTRLAAKDKGNTAARQEPPQHRQALTSQNTTATKRDRTDNSRTVQTRHSSHDKDLHGEDGHGPSDPPELALEQTGQTDGTADNEADDMTDVNDGLDDDEACPACKQKKNRRKTKKQEAQRSEFGEHGPLVDLVIELVKVEMLVTCAYPELTPSENDQGEGGLAISLQRTMQDEWIDRFWSDANDRLRVSRDLPVLESYKITRGKAESVTRAQRLTHEDRFLSSNEENDTYRFQNEIILQSIQETFFDNTRSLGNRYRKHFLPVMPRPVIALTCCIIYRLIKSYESMNARVVKLDYEEDAEFYRRYLRTMSNMDQKNQAEQLRKHQGHMLETCLNIAAVNVVPDINVEWEEHDSEPDDEYAERMRLLVGDDWDNSATQAMARRPAAKGKTRAVNSQPGPSRRST